MWTFIAVAGFLFLLSVYVGVTRKRRSGRPLKNFHPYRGGNEGKPYYEYDDWKELTQKGSLHGEKIDI